LASGVFRESIVTNTGTSNDVKELHVNMKKFVGGLFLFPPPIFKKEVI
jgi:hypothetical protein